MTDPTFCPECGLRSDVTDSRAATNGRRRRRRCDGGHSWSTIEVLAEQFGRDLRPHTPGINVVLLAKYLDIARRLLP